MPKRAVIKGETAPKLPRGRIRTAVRDQIQGNLQSTVERLEEWEKSEDWQKQKFAMDAKLRYGLGAPDSLTKDEVRQKLKETRDYLIAQLGLEAFSSLAGGLSEIWD